MNNDEYCSVFLEENEEYINKMLDRFESNSKNCSIYLSFNDMKETVQLDPAGAKQGVKVILMHSLLFIDGDNTYKDSSTVSIANSLPTIFVMKPNPELHAYLFDGQSGKTKEKKTLDIKIFNNNEKKQEHMSRAIIARKFYEVSGVFFRMISRRFSSYFVLGIHYNYVDMLSLLDDEQQKEKGTFSFRLLRDGTQFSS